jgi:hypothetical protein
MHAVPLSALLRILAGALGLAGTPWSKIWDRRSITQTYRDIKTGKDRSSLYSRVDSQKEGPTPLRLKGDRLSAHAGT